ncbi:MAG: hydantoinase/oxoprolinase family protein, partial [Candidatus Helarchaeota archaeon]
RATIPSIVHHVQVKGKKSRISFEKFALMADIHLVLNNIKEKDYTCDTADGRPIDRINCLARISRIVCADLEMLDENEILNIAKQIYDAQIKIISKAIAQVSKNYKINTPHAFPVIVLGLGGEILGAKAAKQLGFNNIIRLSDIYSKEESKVAPSLAVAYMLGKKMEELS